MKIRRKVLGLAALVAGLMAMLAIVPAFAAMSQGDVKFGTTVQKTDADGETVKVFVKDSALTSVQTETLYWHFDAVVGSKASGALSEGQAAAKKYTFSLAAEDAIFDADGNGVCTNESITLVVANGAGTAAATDCQTIVVTEKASPAADEVWATDTTLTVGYPLGNGAGNEAAIAADIAGGSTLALLNATVNGGDDGVGVVNFSKAFRSSGMTLVAVDSVVDDAGNNYSVLTSNSAGTVKLVGALEGDGANDAVKVKWLKIVVRYNVVDSYAGTSDSTKRVKVTSTSDPVGEWIKITEVVSDSSDAASSDSGVFEAVITVKTDASALTSNDPAAPVIWAKDGDTVTLSYYGATGSTVVKTATLVVDGAAGTITSASPAAKTVTNSTIPIIEVTAADGNSGFDAANPGNHVKIYVGTDSAGANGTEVSPAFTAASSSSISAIYSAASSWLTLHSGVIADSTADYWAVKVIDKAGNQKIYTYEITIDTTKPTMGAAATGAACVDGVDKTNVRTGVAVAFSNGPLDASTISVEDFTVAGKTPSAVVVGTATTCTNHTVYLTVDSLASDAKPEVKAVGDIRDTAGNALSLATAANVTKTAADGLQPIVSNVVISEALLSSASTKTKTIVTFDVDENVGTPVVKIQEDGATADVAVTTPAANSFKAEITTTVPTALSLGVHGISIQVDDGNNKTTYGTSTISKSVKAGAKDNAATPVDWASATINKLNFVFSTGAIANTDADNSILDQFTVTINGTATTECTFTSFNSETATLVLSDKENGDGDADCEIDTNDVVIVTTKSVSTSVQVDNAASVVTSVPANNGEIEKKGVVYVTINVDENEYVGDTYKTVTVKSASLNGTAISLTSSDGYTWIYPIADAPLGEHTIKAKFTDSAGNISTELSTKFTVKAKAAYSVGLNPGWNLISLPGDPADSSVSAVLSGTDADTVVSYQNGEWLVATHSDGSWSGTLTNVVSGNGYWIQTPAPGTVKSVLADQSATGALPTISVIKGWNLIGVTDLTQNPAGTARVGYLSAITAKSVYTYDTVGTTWTKVTDLDTLATGKGYWVWSNAAGAIVP